MAYKLKQKPIYDFSSWEDRIQWDKMTGDQKPQAVIMRASIQGAGGRNRFEDVTAVSYVNECKARGFKYGLYHFLSPNGIAEQAALFLSVWNKCGGADLAPMVDVEIDLNQSYPAYKNGKVVGSTIGNAVWRDQIRVFLNLISAGTGKTPMIYTNEKSWAFTMTRNPLFPLQFVPPTWTADYPLYVAQYPTQPDLASVPAKLPSGWKTWALWQWEDGGRQNGYLANDLNIASDWYSAELDGIVSPPPVVDPPPVVPPVGVHVTHNIAVNSDGSIDMDGVHYA